MSSFFVVILVLSSSSPLLSFPASSLQVFLLFWEQELLQQIHVHVGQSRRRQGFLRRPHNFSPSSFPPSFFSSSSFSLTTSSSSAFSFSCSCFSPSSPPSTSNPFPPSPSCGRQNALRFLLRLRDTDNQLPH